MHSHRMKFAAAIGLLLFAQPSAGRTLAGSLEAGAARVEITPAADALPGPYSSILDPLDARAIFLENGQSRAVLLNADIGAILTFLTDNVAAQIARELNVPATNVLISATHDHNAIFGGAASPAAASNDADTRVSAFQSKLVSGLVAAAKQAKARMQAARIGFGTGNLYLNVNRDAIDEQSRLWSQEPNLDYPSDKTLAVVKIESTNGELIAVYMNYAMHAVSLFLNGKVSGDFPGEAERYIERTFGDKVVALWTSGAAGDQNPLYLRANRKISEARIQAVMEAEHVDLGTAILHAMFVGNPAADKMVLDPVALEQSVQLVKSEGQITAEEALRVMDHIHSMSSEVKIEGAVGEVTCPARKRLDSAREGAPGRYEDSSDPFASKSVRCGSETSF